jgi:hypothetical protein
MFEEIFFPRTAERYRAAPLVAQRERYLVHLRETGAKRATLRKCANEKLRDGLAECLPLDVPQRAFDRGERRIGEDAPQPPPREIIEAVDVTIDVAGILAKRIGAKRLDDFAELNAVALAAISVDPWAVSARKTT